PIPDMAGLKNLTALFLANNSLAGNVDGLIPLGTAVCRLDPNPGVYTCKRNAPSSCLSGISEGSATICTEVTSSTFSSTMTNNVAAAVCPTSPVNSSTIPASNPGTVEIAPSPGAPVAAIAGGVVGGVVGIAAVGAVLMFVARRRKNPPGDRAGLLATSAT
ncbi:hypothetical protein HDU93_009774, partial [Gonapodya sp. JEL0774]